MFDWYARAQVCCAYLADVPDLETDPTVEQDLARATELVAKQSLLRRIWDRLQYDFTRNMRPRM